MFAIRLKTLREEAKLSQAQLALKLGVRQSTVGMWENGKNKPQNSKLEQLASIFGVSTDYLLGRTNDPIDKPAPIEQHATDQHHDGPRTTEARILSAGIDKMPARDRERALRMIRIAFDQYDEYFKEGNDDDDT